MPNQSTNPVLDNTTDVLAVFKTEAGDMYMDIQCQTAAGTGPNPETAAVHVYRIPIMAKIS
jgi:hypothetical protein